MTYLIKQPWLKDHGDLTEKECFSLNDNGFSFYDKENTTELELRRTVNNLDVCIIFQSK